MDSYFGQDIEMDVDLDIEIGEYIDIGFEVYR